MAEARYEPQPLPFAKPTVYFFIGLILVTVGQAAADVQIRLFRATLSNDPLYSAFRVPSLAATVMMTGLVVIVIAIYQMFKRPGERKDVGRTVQAREEYMTTGFIGLVRYRFDILPDEMKAGAIAGMFWGPFFVADMLEIIRHDAGFQQVFSFPQAWIAFSLLLIGGAISMGMFFPALIFTRIWNPMEHTLLKAIILAIALWLLWLIVGFLDNEVLPHEGMYLRDLLGNLVAASVFSYSFRRFSRFSAPMT